MNLFMDTSTNIIMLALIDDNKKVVDLVKINSNKDMVKNTNFQLQIFLNKNKVTNNSISKIYFTLGPGSFTGAKVSFLIAKMYHLYNPQIKFYVINTLDLMNRRRINPVIFIEKSNYYLYKWNWKQFRKKIFLTKTFPKRNFLGKKYEINFETFSKRDLEKKLSYFKMKFIDEVQIIYTIEN